MWVSLKSNLLDFGIERLSILGLKDYRCLSVEILFVLLAWESYWLYWGNGALGYEFVCWGLWEVLIMFMWVWESCCNPIIDSELCFGRYIYKLPWLNAYTIKCIYICLTFLCGVLEFKQKWILGVLFTLNSFAK